MDLATEPDIYTPSVDEDGKYIDKIPSFFAIKNGLRCQCMGKKDKTYSNYGMFASHIKTKCHQKWLENLNLNKANYYVETEELKQIIKNQRLIISKMEKDLNSKMLTIDYLARQLTGTIETMCEVKNLIDFD
jgi:hypothetical protein